MANDPNRLIFESYNIEGVTEQECRSIFFGWAVSLDEAFDPFDAIKNLLDNYESSNPNHPMTRVLREGLKKENLVRSRRFRRKKLKNI